MKKAFSIGAVLAVAAALVPVTVVSGRGGEGFALGLQTCDAEVCVDHLWKECEEQMPPKIQSCSTVIGCEDW